MINRIRGYNRTIELNYAGRVCLDHTLHSHPRHLKNVDSIVHSQDILHCTAQNCDHVSYGGYHLLDDGHYDWCVIWM